MHANIYKKHKEFNTKLQSPALILKPMMNKKAPTPVYPVMKQALRLQKDVVKTEIISPKAMKPNTYQRIASSVILKSNDEG
jgi:hypothetical protein